MMTLTSALAHIVRLADELARVAARSRRGQAARCDPRHCRRRRCATTRPRPPAELGRDQAPPAQLASQREGLSNNIARRHMSKGQQAMAVAMIYPEAQKNTGRRRAKDENALKIKAIPVNSGLLSQARTVLRHSREQ
jgi:hypothetical protein